MIPVGPYPENVKWLAECIESVCAQILKPEQVVFVNDMSSIDFSYFDHRLWKSNIETYWYDPPWRLGVGHAFNFGVRVAPTECVFMLGSDDTLEPDCLERCMEAYNVQKRFFGYYWVPVRYMDDGSVQALPCNAAMITKSLWKRTGGFPVEAVTAPDAALVSIMLKHPEAGMLIKVGDKPLYNYRRHPGTDTARHGAWLDITTRTRDLLTREWEPPQWTR